jgi:hypothetical protein
VFPAQGLTSLLGVGPLAVLPKLAAFRQPLPPAWLRAPFYASAALPQQLLLGQLGLKRPVGLTRWGLPPSVVASKVKHHVTCRYGA